MFLNGRQIKIASFFNQPPVVIYGTTILFLIGLQILNECGVVPLLTLTSTEVSLLTTLKSFLSPPPSLWPCTLTPTQLDYFIVVPLKRNYFTKCAFPRSTLNIASNSLSWSTSTVAKNCLRFRRRVHLSDLKLKLFLLNSNFSMMGHFLVHFVCIWETFSHLSQC